MAALSTATLAPASDFSRNGGPLGTAKASGKAVLKSAVFSNPTLVRNCVHDGSFVRTSERRSSNFCVFAASSKSETLPFYEEGELERPLWSGDRPLAKFVAFLISIKPLFSVMKVGARNTFIKTAEDSGIPWTKIVTELSGIKELEDIKERIENKSLVYPSYYLQEFHGYDKGNLCWEAAFEVEPATYVMCKRALPHHNTYESASAALRGGWLLAINRHLQEYSDVESPERIIDIGCSVGISTRCLADAFPDAEVFGLDASPYFLSVAIHKERERTENGKKEIKYIHALGEDTGLPSNHFDIVSVAFVVHECPENAIIDIFREAKRILKPGGVLTVTDNSPKSKVIQNLPGPIYLLMKSTEPWYDASFKLNLDQVARDAGFKSVVTILTDPRHRTLTATA